MPKSHEAPLTHSTFRLFRIANTCQLYTSESPDNIGNLYRGRRGWTKTAAAVPRPLTWPLWLLPTNKAPLKWAGEFLHGRKLWKRTDLRMWEELWHHREKLIPLPGATFGSILIVEPRLRITANSKGKKGGKWVEEGR